MYKFVNTVRQNSCSAFNKNLVFARCSLENRCSALVFVVVVFVVVFELKKGQMCKYQSYENT